MKVQLKEFSHAIDIWGVRESEESKITKIFWFVAGRMELSFFKMGKIVGK